MAKTMATMVNITRLAVASVQSRPWAPNLVKVWPSSQIMDANGNVGGGEEDAEPDAGIAVVRPDDVQYKRNKSRVTQACGQQVQKGSPKVDGRATPGKQQDGGERVGESRARIGKAAVPVARVVFRAVLLESRILRSICYLDLANADFFVFVISFDKIHTPITIRPSENNSSK